MPPLLPLVDHRGENFGERAPISEALVDIRVERDEADEDVDDLLDRLRSFSDPERPEREMRTQVEWAGQIDLAPESAVSISHSNRIRGFVFSEGPEVVQVRRDGFTFSRLPPYTSWDDFRTKALVDWSRYIQVAPASKILRVGLRYINRLKMPPGSFSASQWFRLHTVTPSVFGALSGFLVRVAMLHPESPAFKARASLGLVSGNDQENEFLFDIDAWVDEPADGHSVERILDDLRVYKNDVFFGALTEQALEEIRK